MTLVANIVGARPQFIKAGPVSKALTKASVAELLIHTGQHYDPLMSADIMRDIGLRDPDVNLGVGSGTHGAQTAGMLAAIEDVLLSHSVDVVVVYGDTNTTIAGALAATKLGIPTAHVEAGLRSFNRAMPEEINRIATDHLSDMLFAPTETAMDHLANEGLGARASLTGDVMVDALESIDLDTVDVPDWATGRFYVATIHRPENTDEPGRLRAIIESLDGLDASVNLLAHPRLAGRLDDSGIRPHGALKIHDPLSYTGMLATVRSSAGLITDSGGLQKEAYILDVPCVTLRSETEWPETLSGGWNVLSEPADGLQALLDRKPDPRSEKPFGDGHAAERIVELLMAAASQDTL
jgi:UDP-N-acetylglucosamine 2-epimerase (non-hydrolysing)